MKSKLLLVVFAALLLVGCTNNQESGLLTNNQKELSSTKTLQVPLIQNEEIDEIVEKDEEKINNSFSSDSKTQHSSSNKTNEDRKTQNDHGTKEEDYTPKDASKPSTDVPTPEPEQPVPAPVPDPSPEPTPVPKDEPKKQFILPSNWTNGDEHNEYYLSLDEAVARVNELWSQRIDAGYSQLYDAETDTTYTWVTWWE